MRYAVLPNAWWSYRIGLRFHQGQTLVRGTWDHLMHSSSETSRSQKKLLMSWGLRTEVRRILQAKCKAPTHFVSHSKCSKFLALVRSCSDSLALIQGHRLTTGLRLVYVMVLRARPRTVLLNFGWYPRLLLLRY